MSHSKFQTIPNNRQVKRISHSKFQTIPNDGQDAGMYNQCMWISLTTYLRIHGFPHMSVRGLRAIAGLRSDTEHTPFDNMKEQFAWALCCVSQYFNIRIYVHSINRDGTPVRNAQPSITDPKDGEIYDLTTYIPTGDVKVVNIAQYGSVHFELITSGPGIDPLNIPGSEFVPAVPIKTTGTMTLKKVSDLSPAEKQLASLRMEAIDFHAIRKTREQDIANEQKQILGFESQRRQTQNSSDLPLELKTQLIDSHTTFIQSSQKIINEYKQQLQNIDEQICLLETHIARLD